MGASRCSRPGAALQPRGAACAGFTPGSQKAHGRAARLEVGRFPRRAFVESGGRDWLGGFPAIIHSPLLYTAQRI